MSLSFLANIATLLGINVRVLFFFFRKRIRRQLKERPPSKKEGPTKKEIKKWDLVGGSKNVSGEELDSILEQIALWDLLIPGHFIYSENYCSEFEFQVKKVIYSTGTERYFLLSKKLITKIHELYHSKGITKIFYIHRDESSISHFATHLANHMHPDLQAIPIRSEGSLNGALANAGENILISEPIRRDDPLLERCIDFFENSIGANVAILIIFGVEGLADHPQSNNLVRLNIGIKHRDDCEKCKRSYDKPKPYAFL